MIHPLAIISSLHNHKEHFLTDITTRWTQLFESLERLESAASLSPHDHLGLVQALGGLRLVQPFNWMAWGGPMVSVEEAEQLGMGDCIRHVTRIVRADRFNEGVLAGAVHSGILQAVCRAAFRRADGGVVPALADAA